MASDYTTATPRSRPQFAPRRRYSSEDVLPRAARVTSDRSRAGDRSPPVGAKVVPAAPADDGPRRPRMQRRKSILVDPDESPDARAARRRSRSRSQVQIQAPADSADGETVLMDGHYVQHRDGKEEFVPRDSTKPRKTPVDLERKTDERSRQFRGKRDGYESDEGQKLRSARSGRPPVYDDDDLDDDRDYRRRPRKAPLDEYDLPKRTISREDEEKLHHPAAVAGAALGGAAAVGMAAASRRRDPDPRRRPPMDPRYDYDDDYPPPRRRRPSVPPSYAYPDSRGYPPRDARPRPRRDDDPYDRRPPPRRRDYDDYDRRPPPPRQRRYDDYDRDPRGDTRRPPRRARSYEDRDRGNRHRDARGDKRDSKAKSQDWTKQAGALFMAQAMPVIKKEGLPFIMKQVANYTGKR